MNPLCNDLQEKLAEAPEADLTPEEHRHMSSCVDCSAVFAALSEMNAAFRAMPEIDAPETTVRKVLDAVAERANDARVSPAVEARDRGRRLLDAIGATLTAILRPRFALPLTAAAAMLLAMNWIATPIFERNDVAFPDVRQIASSEEVAATADGADARGKENSRFVDEDRGAMAAEGEADNFVSNEEYRSDSSKDALPGYEQGQLERLGYTGERKRDRAGDDQEAPRENGAGEPLSGNEWAAHDSSSRFDQPKGRYAPSRVPSDRLTALPASPAAAEPVPGPLSKPANEPDLAFAKSAYGGAKKAELERQQPAGSRAGGLAGGALSDKRSKSDVQSRFELDDESRKLRPDDSIDDALARFEQERATVDGLTFLDPHGYWANTYLPGDPAMRLLQARLAAHDRSALQQFVAAPLRLDDAAHPIEQPFDAPDGAAIGVFVRGDQRAVQGKTRMLVEVGLKGTSRFSGRRPAMNVGIVLDLRGAISAETAARVRALVMAFAQAKEPDDRFTLVVAGKPGGVLVQANEFKNGPLTVALQSVLDGTTNAEPGASLDPISAVRAATATVRTGDDPNAPLGSSLLVLVTSQSLGVDAAPLATAAHENAVTGIPLSVVGVGNAVHLDELDRIALAGQGNRRLLTAGSEATALVDGELASVGRAVARVVRLNLRLAPNVELVDVVGSRRLDALRAEQIREAERSIDQRTSRNLGITADRGEDEDGIQIVIPTFYAGDAHAVLLDVVVPGPGPVVDVTARYKDLTSVRNGVARASLSLDRGNAEPGPLERNVLRSYLALRLSQALQAAGRELHAHTGAPRASIERLSGHLALLRGLQTSIPEFRTDRDLADDIALLDEYVALLRSPAPQSPQPRAQLADSLELAGKKKIAPIPR